MAARTSAALKLDHDFESPPADPRSRPRVITLCGSTRFLEYFEAANRELTLRGNVVFSVATAAYEGSGNVTAEQKARLDRVHLEKIRLSDEILVLNIDGYIGESTAREIEFAKRIGRPIRYWVDPSIKSLPK